MGFAEDQLTRDKFLNGQLTILQPRAGYRAGVDPVFLAASVAAKPGQSVLELGCGVGVASLCLGHRVAGLDMSAVEVQASYGELARRNAADNDIKFSVTDGDLNDLPGDLRNRIFDHVIANPPYFQRTRGTPARDAGRDTALAGQTPLVDWIDAATRRLGAGGYLTLIQQAARLQDVMCAMDGRLGSLVVQPFAPRIGRASELMIVQARKGGRGALKLAAPIILHKGARHVVDAESYTDEIRAVLRDGAALMINR